MEVKGSEPQGRRREAGSEGSGEQTREPMDKNRVQKSAEGIVSRAVGEANEALQAERRSTR
jgi:hypothetical protein